MLFGRVRPGVFNTFSYLYLVEMKIESVDVLEGLFDQLSKKTSPS